MNKEAQLGIIIVVVIFLLVWWLASIISSKKRKQKIAGKNIEKERTVKDLIIFCAAVFFVASLSLLSRDARIEWQREKPVAPRPQPLYHEYSRLADNLMPVAPAIFKTGGPQENYYKIADRDVDIYKISDRPTAPGIYKMVYQGCEIFLAKSADAPMSLALGRGCR